VRSADNGDTEILRVDPDGFVKIYSCDVFEECAPVHFEKSGKRVYMETNKGGALDLSALMLLDPATGNTEIVESDPMKGVVFGAAVFSELTDELAQTNYIDDRTRRYFRDKSFEADYMWLEQKFPGREVGVVSRTLDEHLWLVLANGDMEP